MSTPSERNVITHLKLLNGNLDRVMLEHFSQYGETLLRQRRKIHKVTSGKLSIESLSRDTDMWKSLASIATAVDDGSLLKVLGTVQDDLKAYVAKPTVLSIVRPGVDIDDEAFQNFTKAVYKTFGDTSLSIRIGVKYTGKDIELTPRVSRKGIAVDGHEDGTQFDGPKLAFEGAIAPMMSYLISIKGWCSILASVKATLYRREIIK